MPNPLLLFAAQIVAILSVLLLAAGYLKTEPKATSARVFAVMAIFIVFYLVIGMSGPNIDPQFRVDLTGWRLLLLFGINAICGLFMIYCFLIFQEQSSFPKPLAAAFGMQVVIDLILSYLAGTVLRRSRQRRLCSCRSAWMFCSWCLCVWRYSGH